MKSISLNNFITCFVLMFRKVNNLTNRSYFISTYNILDLNYWSAYVIKKLHMQFVVQPCQCLPIILLSTLNKLKRLQIIFNSTIFFKWNTNETNLYIKQRKIKNHDGKCDWKTVHAKSCKDYKIFKSILHCSAGNNFRKKLLFKNTIKLNSQLQI